MSCAGDQTMIICIRDRYYYLGHYGLSISACAITMLAVVLVILTAVRTNWQEPKGHIVVPHASGHLHESTLKSPQSQILDL